MNAKQYVFAVILMVFAGFSGGMLGARFFASQPAMAGEEAIKAVEARKFNLIDENGVVRATLGWNEFNGPSLRMFNIKGEERMALGIAENVPKVDYIGEFYVLDENGKPRLALAYWDDMPRLDILDSDGTLRASVGAGQRKNQDTGEFDKYPESAIHLFDKTSRVIWTVPESSMRLLE